MTRPNRVLPTGEIVALPLRGTLMGNRGVLHDEHGALGRARWRHKAWIACVLRFKDRRREVMAPGRYTELFFLNEAVALAAGHRPCAECRRADYERFRDAWEVAHGERPSAAEMDRVLHAARLDGRAQRRHRVEWSSLPDGVFVWHEGAACLVRGGALLPFTEEGYGEPLPRPDGGEAEVMTPAPIVAVLRAGYAVA